MKYLVHLLMMVSVLSVQYTHSQLTITGSPGQVGATGEQGVPGQDGLAGIPGGQGPTGATGVKGMKGDIGELGGIGEPGATGSTGATGAQYQGATGLPGDGGNKGAPGATGNTGATGATGPKGVLGAKGDSGDAGDVGPRATAGQQGDQGQKGEIGVKGDVGPEGLPGLVGEPGDRGGQGAVYVNECGAGACPDDSLCVNTPLGAECHCQQHGYEYNRQTKTCDSVRGQCIYSNGLCEDKCVPVNSTYQCQCDKPGFTLSPRDKHTCIDVNECDDTPCIGEREVCINTYGSYLCVDTLTVVATPSEPSAQARLSTSLVSSTMLIVMVIWCSFLTLLLIIIMIILILKRQNHLKTEEYRAKSTQHSH